MQGTLEAITDSLRKLERPDVKLSFVHRGVGGITENDVQLAVASNATIIGFNVRPDRRAREMAVERDVEIRTYEVIYKLLEDIEAAMVGMLAPEFEEVVTGEAEVRDGLPCPAGRRGGRLLRPRRRRSRADRRSASCARASSSGRARSPRCAASRTTCARSQAGFECGIGLSDFQDLKEGDIIETFEEREIPAPDGRPWTARCGGVGERGGAQRR